MVSEAVERPKRRLWLVFFSKNFGHVSAASFYADQNRWVYVDAVRTALVVEVAEPDEFGGRLQQLINDSEAILRFPAAADRKRAPFSFFCVGAVKSLLGIRCCALWPRGLYRHLLRMGAERVTPENPTHESNEYEDAAGRPGSQAAA